jgi:hypothetical protein
MKYLKTYNEKVGVRLNSELKSTVEDLLIELRDEEFDTKVSEIDYHSQKVKVKVSIESDKEFTYSYIKSQIESVWSYLNGEGFEIEHFTCVEDENFEESDEFTINQKVKGFHWTTDPETFGVKSIEKEYQRRPIIYCYIDVDKWKFEIIFTKDKIDVDKSRGHLSINEELDPKTYISAADKLKRMGHKRRPADLEDWSDVMKQRKLDSKKARVLAEAKKLGQFKFRFLFYNNKTKSQEVEYGNYYPYFEINYDELSSQKLEYLENNSAYYLPISMGLIPVDEEDRETLVSQNPSQIEESQHGIYWIQDIYFNLSISHRFAADDTPFLTHLKKENPNNKLNPINDDEIIPNGTLSIQSSICSEIYLGDRSNAIKFRKMLINLFEGDIDFYFEKNNNFINFNSEIIEQLCDAENDPISPEEYQRFLDSIRFIPINSLYRD